MFLVKFGRGPLSNFILHWPIQLTRSTLLHLLRCNREYREHLNHDFHEYLRNILVRRNPSSVNPKALEEELNALEEVDEHIVARLDILRCLQDIDIKA
jgi:hypothetical protein